MEKNKQDNYICRAKIAPAVDESYDFEAVAVPSANGQMKYNFMEGEYFNQVLRTAPENIDTSRLDEGIPLFDNHPEMEDISVFTTYGITTSYSFDERGLVVRCKFGSRADEILRNDVKNGIMKTVSIEGTIQNYSIKRDLGQIPVYYADLWTPESLSFAPVPNDIGAQIEVKRAIQKQIEIKQELSTYQILTNKF